MQEFVSLYRYTRFLRAAEEGAVVGATGGGRDTTH